jgi:hypothetical protein
MNHKAKAADEVSLFRLICRVLLLEEVILHKKHGIFCDVEDTYNTFLDFEIAPTHNAMFLVGLVLFLVRFMNLCFNPFFVLFLVLLVIIEQSL